MSESYHFGLIGSNIGYSQSPAVFAAIFDVDGIDGRFELFDLSPETFDDEFQRVIASGPQGLSVTIPYKKKIIEKLHELGPTAEALHAVNSIALGETLRGFNTDVDGFALPLEPFASQLRGHRALVLGSGGGARAAAFALTKKFGVAEVVVAGRALDSLMNCCRELQAAMPDACFSPVLLSDFESHRANTFAVTVNSTPLGGWNHPDLSPLPEGFDWARAGLYYDLNYNELNRLVESARMAGLTVLDGSRMLVAQAVRSYGLWTGREVSFDAVHALAFSR